MDKSVLELVATPLQCRPRLLIDFLEIFGFFELRKLDSGS